MVHNSFGDNGEDDEEFYYEEQDPSADYKDGHSIDTQERIKKMQEIKYTKRKSKAMESAKIPKKSQKPASYFRLNLGVAPPVSQKHPGQQKVQGTRTLNQLSAKKEMPC